MFKNEFLNFQGKLYIIKRVLKEEYNPDVEIWKEHLGADLVLRKDGLLYFVEEIPDLEILPNDTLLTEINP
jgi:hypothetical protein